MNLAVNLAVNVTFFSPPHSGKTFGGKAPKCLFCLDLSRIGLSFELSVKVLIASKTNGMTRAEPHLPRPSPRHKVISAAAEARLQHSSRAANHVTKSSRLQLKRVCSILLAPQRTGCVAAIGWQPPHQSQSRRLRRIHQRARLQRPAAPYRRYQVTPAEVGALCLRSSASSVSVRVETYKCGRFVLYMKDYRSWVLFELETHARVDFSTWPILSAH